MFGSKSGSALSGSSHLGRLDCSAIDRLSSRQAAASRGLDLALFFWRLGFSEKVAGECLEAIDCHTKSSVDLQLFHLTMNYS